MRLALLIAGLLLAAGWYWNTRGGAAAPVSAREISDPALTSKNHPPPDSATPSRTTFPPQSSGPPPAPSAAASGEVLTPEQLAKVRDAQREVVAALYRDLESELRIGKGEADAIRAIVLDRLMRDSMLSSTQILNGGEEKKSQDEMLRDVAKLLDAERQARFAEFQRSLDARAQVEWLRAMLEEARLPLSEDQRREFIRSAIRNGAFLDPEDDRPAESDTAFARDLVIRSQQRDALLVESARGILSGRQLDKVKAHFKERHQALNNALFSGG